MNFYLSAEYQFVNPVQNDVLFGTKSLFCVQNAFLCLFVRIVRKRVRDAAFFLIIMLVTFAATL